ncbi:MAG: hypothetical protein L3K19_06635 [Thermoplasmata archaeon]|nr:hypothetical protein [Thermoplasmata archaeon]
MSPKRVKTTRAPRGAQKWVLAELRGLQAGAQLSTTKIAKRIAKASGRTFHKNSVYNALRLLVQKGEISVVRKGVQKTYHIASPIRAGTRTPSTPVARPAPSAPAVPSVPPAAEMEMESVAPALPHKLAVGEVLVLEITERDVLTATNQHGRVVVERHPLPS